MGVEVKPMNKEDWPTIAEIYQMGIVTGKATFQTEIPSFSQWDAEHIRECRLVVKVDGKIAGWAALSTVSKRYVYRGIAEVSIYISPEYQGQRYGTTLLNHMVEESEKAGFWTLQSGIMDDNIASVKLHESCGFRKIGLRERIGRDINGKWRSTVLMERRSNTVGID